MRRGGVLLLIGVALLVVAGVSIMSGVITQAPLLTLSTLLVAGIVLGVGLLRARGAAPVVRTGNPGRTMAIARVIVIALGVMGSIALIVAIVVAEGEARGHAIGHLVFGLVALALFAGLAFRWRPEPGANASFVRGASLSLLGVAAFGFFLESLGGAGYDAANEEHRIRGAGRDARRGPADRRDRRPRDRVRCSGRLRGDDDVGVPTRTRDLPREARRLVP
ncbi:MAG: hypothetical protein M3O29_04135 [Actinomycetota bacterium]|nr:hypothetical protein [Actinomycetota bacterium]